MKVNLSLKKTYLFLPLICAFFLLTNTVDAKNNSAFSCMISQQDDSFLPFAEVMPAPVGGLEAIYKKIVYPEIAKKAGLEGKVYVLVYVDENGSVDNAKVIKDIGGGCGEAAVKAIRATRYTPGKNKGASVKVKLSMAIAFKMR